MAKPRITLRTPYDSPGTLVFLMPKILAKFQPYHSQWGPNRGGVGSIFMNCSISVVHLSQSVSDYLYVCLCVYDCTCICLSECLVVCMFVSLYLTLYVCLTVYLTVSVFVKLLLVE